MQRTVTDPALTRVFAARGPFVTLYLDAGRPAGSDVDVVDGRWAVIRDDLAAAGADEDVLDAVEEVLPVRTPIGRSFGLVVVAGQDGVCLRERIDPPGASHGSFSALPDLMPYLRARTPALPHLVVASLVGRTRILQIEGGELVRLWPTDGTDRLDVPGIVAVIAKLTSRVDPELVMLSGDAESCRNLLGGLGRRLVDDVQIQMIGDATSDDSLLADAIAALRDRERADRVDLLARVRRLAGDRDRVAAGARDVAAALRMAQVETAVLVDGPTLSTRCWVGARPTEFGTRDAEASDVGVRTLRHDRIGSALVRAAVATGARLVIIAADEQPTPQDVAALLR